MIIQPKFKESLVIPNLENCINLVNNNNSFVSKIENIDGVDVITFSYRLSSYFDFNQKYARNIRSISFNLNTKKCIVLSLHKFFNYNENLFTDPKIIKKWTPTRITEKIDGSLIMFFIINDKLFAKTKYNMFSKQSELAMDIVNSNTQIKNSIYSIIKNGYTPMFELVHPDDPHVIDYNKKSLYYLMSRNYINGEYKFHNNLAIFDTPNNINTTIDDIVNDIQNDNIKDKEGFVVHFSNGEMVKFKYIQYVNNHNIINNNCYTYELVAKIFFDETLDDILAIVPSTTKDEIMSKLSKIKYVYNNYINKLNTIYNQIFNSIKNKTSRKEFAIYAKENFDFYFNMLMVMYKNSGELNQTELSKYFIKNKLWEMGEI